MRIIRPSEYRVMPWKNGGGETTEVFVSPSTGPFDWRVSIATVNEDGPFSNFAGYERHIMVLSGRGMALDVAGRGKFELEPLKPFSFSGDAQVIGSLPHGPVLDFNFMVRREFGRGVLHVLEGEAGCQPGSGQFLRLVHVLHGECAIGRDQLHPQDSFYLGAGERVDLPVAMTLAVCEVTTLERP